MLMDGIESYFAEEQYKRTRCDHIETVPLDIGDREQPYRSVILHFRCKLMDGHSGQHEFSDRDATVSLCDQA